MPVTRSPGAPADELLGATMSSDPPHAPASLGRGAAASREAPPQRISAVGDTLISASVQPPAPAGIGDTLASASVQPAAGSPGASTRREPLPALSGIDQTAMSDPDDASIGPPTTSAPRREDPRTIQRFEVLRRLGAGGMGVVYAAYDWELERRLAIKVVREDGMTSDASKQRIMREAKAMAKVSHPNVVQVFEVGSFAGQIFVAMEYIKGKSLSEWLQAEERTWQEILEVYVQAGRGLAAAHRQGVVHRDFKPENVLVDAEGRAHVLDFGLARAESSATESDSALLGRVAVAHDSIRDNLTLAGAIMGTPAFMSPEQHLGRPADARSDQFSFCVALYTGLYGQPPFAGETLYELRESVTAGDLRPPPEGTRVPAWVFAALQVGLAPEPADRYPSMDTLLAAVSPEVVSVPRRRWLWPVALVGATALAVALTLLFARGAGPTGEDLAAIARLEQEARDAAARQLWVYPELEDPRDTAYNRVILLEHLEGPAAERGLATAQALRAEFADHLVVLGDANFNKPEARAFARDFYRQAQVFVPDHPVAADRSLATPGLVADFADRAGRGELSESEILAAEPLRVLADPDPVSAGRRALELLDPDASSALVNAQLAALFVRNGVITDADLQRLAEAQAPNRLARAEPRPPPAPEPAPPPVAEPEPEPPPPTPTKTRPKQPRPEPAAPPPADPPAETAPPEDMTARVDPDGSRALAGDGDAARRRGDAAAAEKLYNKALDLWNANAVALIGLSDLAFERGSFDRAVKYAEKAVRAEPANAEYQIRLGDAYFKVFRYSDAQQRYQKAADLGHARAAERLARVQDKLGG